MRVVARLAYSVAEAAEIAGVAYDEVYGACRSGYLGYWVTTYRIRVLREDLEEWMALRDAGWFNERDWKLAAGVQPFDL